MAIKAPKGPNGGPRTNGGRKKTWELEAVKELFGPHVQDAVDCLVSAAKEGNVKAAEIILAYTYGKPQQAVEVEGGIKVLVEYVGEGIQTEDGESV
jgi:hypothetical protein